jgi:hypothetical protein
MTVTKTTVTSFSILSTSTTTTTIVTNSNSSTITGTTISQGLVFLYNLEISVKIKDINFISDYANLLSTASITLKNQYFSVVSQI